MFPNVISDNKPEASRSNIQAKYHGSGTFLGKHVKHRLITTFFRTHSQLQKSLYVCIFQALAIHLPCYYIRGKAETRPTLIIKAHIWCCKYCNLYVQINFTLLRSTGYNDLFNLSLVKLKLKREQFNHCKTMKEPSYTGFSIPNGL